jgi:hypothetical protein
MLGEPQTRQGFVVEPLKRSQLRAVYPLVQHAGVSIDLKTWLRYARPLAEPHPNARRGAITVRRVQAKLPCGLFCYAREPDLVHGNVLRAEHFVALDIVNPDEALAALLDGLDFLSTQLGIRTVRAVVGPGEEAVTAVMRGAGLSTDAQIFTKILVGHDRAPVPGIAGT